MEKKKISCPCRESNPSRAARNSSLCRQSYPGSCNSLNVLLYAEYFNLIVAYIRNLKQGIIILQQSEDSA
jgi:hypothetical protein